jgi:acetyl-CoA synthetase
MRQINHIDEYFADYQRSIEAPEAFWGEIAEDFLWQKKWDTVLDWNFSEPSIKWFDGGVCNLSENCIDRHLAQAWQSNCYYLGTE